MELLISTLITLVPFSYGEYFFLVFGQIFQVQFNSSSYLTLVS